MIFSQQFFAHASIWVAYVTYFLSMVPQIFLNFRLRSTKGLSNLFLLGILHRNFAWVGYAFSLNLPLSYKIMAPALALASAILVIQRLFYSKAYGDKKVLFWYVFNFFIAFFLIFYAIGYSILVGHFLGWLNIVIGFFNEIPQALNIQARRSCKGFSLSFVLISMVAYFFEFFASLLLYFPSQVIYCSLKGIVFRFLFLFQFAFYRE